jgi:MYXO-CTERM domain-containing protein
MNTLARRADASIDPRDTRRLLRRSTLLLAAAAVSLVARAAAADVLLPDTKRIAIAVTFTVEGGGHLVAFPSECMKVDLNLNPHLKFYPNYDVIDTSKPRAPYKFCGPETALYVLDEATFPKIKGTEEASWRRSEWRLEAVDRLPLPERAAFFASSAGIRATGYTMPADDAISERSPLQEVQERVTISQGKASKVEITYVYTDSVKETLTYPAGKRPQPSRKEARDWMAGLWDGSTPPVASSSGSSTVSAPAASAPAGAGAGSCAGCRVPAEEPGSGLFLTFVLGVGLAVARRRR